MQQDVSQPADRIATLDIVRGVAVMGILAMNIVAFAMPAQAYMNPLAYGTETAADWVSYAFSFVFIDGKMRGLFSFLFGASMLLMIQRTEAQGRSSASLVLRRQLALLLFGMIHFYLIWWGDILIGYALMGLLAFLFRHRSAKALVRIAIGLLIAQFAIFAASAFYAHSLAPIVAGPAPDRASVEAWEMLAHDIAIPTAEQLADIMKLYLGPWSGFVELQTGENLAMPLFFTFFMGSETLAYMLLGMAMLKSGMLTGAWTDQRYWRAAAIALAVGVAAYVLILWRLFVDGFTVPGIFTWTFAATVPFRPIMVVGYAALIVLATRHGGWLVDRIAAAGRAAFTNYLGASIVMTGIFYGWGLGLFGALGRAELWLVVLPAWAVVLAWSKPWLDRFQYGPFEWLWRSLARLKLQPMRHPAPAAA